MKEIYERLLASGEQNIVVLGDLNDTPDSPHLRPLLEETDLKDISIHPALTDDGRSGTFKSGARNDKLDYVLLSPALFGKGECQILCVSGSGGH